MLARLGSSNVRLEVALSSIVDLVVEVCSQVGRCIVAFLASRELIRTQVRTEP